MLPGGGDTRPSAKLSCPTSRSTICNPSESIFQNESREESCGNRKVTGIVQRSPPGRGGPAGSISAKHAQAALRKAPHAAWRIHATLLAGSAAYGHGGRTMALTACAWNCVALAGRACLAMGDRDGGSEPPRLAALEHRAPARPQGGPRRFWQRGRALSRRDDGRAGRLGRGTQNCGRDRAFRLYGV